MSSYLLYTLETSRADGVAPSDALPYVAPLRRRRDPDALVFGGNLVVRADGGYHDDVVEHACERLGVPRYARYTYNDTSDAGHAYLYERTERGWTEVHHERAWWEEMDREDAVAYRPARGDDVPPDPEYSRWENEHPAAVLQREYDFDTVGNYSVQPPAESTGVVTECSERAVADRVDADATYHAIWTYRSADDVPPSPERRLSAAYEAVSGYRDVVVDDVALFERTVAVTLTAPPMLPPQKVACLLRWPASEAYRDRWNDGTGVPTGRADGVFDGSWNVADAVAAVRESDSWPNPSDLRVHVAWRTPATPDVDTAEGRVAAAADRWAFEAPTVVVRDDTLAVGVDVELHHSPWLVAHLLRDALHGDGRPDDPIAFDGRPVAVSTTSESPTALSSTLRE